MASSQDRAGVDRKFLTATPEASTGFSDDDRSASPSDSLQNVFRSSFYNSRVFERRERTTLLLKETSTFKGKVLHDIAQLEKVREERSS